MSRRRKKRLRNMIRLFGELMATACVVYGFWAWALLIRWMV